jgi:glyoxylase-like metal-dependent hydrolase (beta-lactamase superfamily II)
MTSLTIGAVDIRRVSEIDRWAFPAAGLFPAMPPELVAAHRDRLGPRFIDPDNDDLILSVHSWVLKVAGRTIVVDTCNGNHKERPNLPPHHRLDTPYLANLAAAGVRPEDVDLVLCTHLHPDHVGWNTRLADGRWVPTFPNARYLMGDRDLADLQALVARGSEDPIEQEFLRTYDDSLLPVLDAGQAEVIASDHVVARELDHGIWLAPAPGHTHGHVAIHVDGGMAHAGGTTRAVLTGDVIHHPLQLVDLSLSQGGDADPAQAEATRRALIERTVDTDTYVLTGHFPAPSAVRFVSRGDGVDCAFAPSIWGEPDGRAAQHADRRT